VRNSLRVTLAGIDLGSTDPALQLQALRTIGETTTVSLMSEVKQLHESETATPEVRGLAGSVLSSLERRVMWVSAGGQSVLWAEPGQRALARRARPGDHVWLMRVINMAHGEMIMLGAYSTFVVQNFVQQVAPGAFDSTWCSPCRWRSWSARWSVLLERTVIRFLYGRPLETCSRPGASASA
jgi:urea transport system permease protein